MADETQTILFSLQDRRRRELIKIQALRRELAAQNPLLRELTRQMLRAYQTGGDPKPYEAEFNKAAGAALLYMGLPADALVYHPQCPLCGDSGRADGALCPCVLNEAAKQANPLGLTQDETTFAQFDESVFPNGEPVAGGVTQRVYMNQVRQMLEDFCQNYPAVQARNLILTGKSGLGKTFLLKCMYSALRFRGVSTVSLTAYRLNELVTAAMAGKDDIAPALTSAVLFVDDLGSEPIFKTTTLQGFFNLFNERLEAGRAAVISTNLTTAEIRARYGERIYSRLTDQRHSRVIPLYGADVRKAR